MRVQRLGRYELLRHLASGGMARVYLARATGPGGFARHVVVKTIPDERRDDDAFIGMFLDEARLVATLHHQHIAQVFEVGRADDGTYYLAMEYVHGETVRHLLEAAGKRGVRLPLEVGLSISCAAAAGLHHAHERRDVSGTPLGIVHRDVSPSNLILGFDGSIKLIDFGIAKATLRSTQTLTGFIKGKAGYMAPEQARGYAVDRRSDVFALGVLAYELTTQTRAFHGESQFETMHRTMRGEIEPPSRRVRGYPPALEDVVMTALEVDPDDRFQDAEAMRIAIEDTARELGLVLGAGPVVRALDLLFSARPEPWLDATQDSEDELTPVVTDSGPMIMIVPRTPTKVRLARGTENDELKERDPEHEPSSPERQSPTTLDLTTEPYERALPAVQHVAQDATVPVKRRPSTQRPAAQPLSARAGTAPLGSRGAASPVVVRAGTLPLPAPASPLTPLPQAAPPVLLPSDTQSVPVAALPPATVAPPVRAPMPTMPSVLRSSRTPVLLIGATGVVVLVTLIGVLAVSSSDEPTARAALPADAIAPAAPPPAPIQPPQPPPKPPAPRPSSAAIAQGATVQLTVTTEPDGATVVLDGVRLGVTPFIARVPMKAGGAWLKVRKRGYIAVKTRVALERDADWSVEMKHLSR